YFGYPQAHEDDAAQGVRAGLALVDAVANLRTDFDAALTVRIGIATGTVVVGDLIGEGAAQEEAVVGGTPNLAARLPAAPEPRAPPASGRRAGYGGDLREYPQGHRGTLRIPRSRPGCAQRLERTDAGLAGRGRERSGKPL